MGFLKNVNSAFMIIPAMAWTEEYNEEREHGPLGMTPREFARSAMESAEIANDAIPALPTAPAATND